MSAHKAEIIAILTVKLGPRNTRSARPKLNSTAAFLATGRKDWRGSIGRERLPMFRLGDGCCSSTTAAGSPTSGHGEPRQLGWTPLALFGCDRAKPFARTRPCRTAVARGGPAYCRAHGRYGGHRNLGRRTAHLQAQAAPGGGSGSGLGRGESGVRSRPDQQIEAVHPSSDREIGSRTKTRHINVVRALEPDVRGRDVAR